VIKRICRIIAHFAGIIQVEQLDCQYIISSVEIKNLSENLELQRIFENEIFI